MQDRGEKISNKDIFNASSMHYIKKKLVHINYIIEKLKTHIFWSRRTKLKLPEMKLIYLLCSKWYPLEIMHIWTWDYTSRCTLHNMLTQTSDIRFQCPHSFGGGVAYSRCLMHLHRKNSSGDYSTKLQSAAKLFEHLR